MDKEKQSVLIEVDDKTYDLKIGLRVIKIVEDMLGKSILTLWKETINQTVKISDLWSVVWGCVNVQNNEITYDKFLVALDEKDTKITDLVNMFLTLMNTSYAKTEPKKKGDSDQKN